MPINLCGHQLLYISSIVEKIILKKQNDFKRIYLANKNTLYYKSS